LRAVAAQRGPYEHKGGRGKCAAGWVDGVKRGRSLPCVNILHAVLPLKMDKFWRITTQHDSSPSRNSRKQGGAVRKGRETWPQHLQSGCNVHTVISKPPKPARHTAVMKGQEILAQRQSCRTHWHAARACGTAACPATHWRQVRP